MLLARRVKSVRRAIVGTCDGRKAFQSAAADRVIHHSRGTSLTSQTRRHNEAGRPAGCAAPDQTPLAKVRYIRESRARRRISSWVSRQSESLKSSPVHFSPVSSSWSCQLHLFLSATASPFCGGFFCFFLHFLEETVHSNKCSFLA